MVGKDIWCRAHCDGGEGHLVQGTGSFQKFPAQWISLNAVLHCDNSWPGCWWTGGDGCGLMSGCAVHGHSVVQRLVRPCVIECAAAIHPTIFVCQLMAW